VLLNWRNKTNVSGLYYAFIRIKIDNTARYYRIEVPKKIQLEEWSGKDDQWVKSSHPFSFEINNKIREKKNIIHELIKQSYNFNKKLSFETIFSHLKKKGDVHFFYDFMQGYINKPPENLEENTLKKYRITLTHLKKFRKQVYFSDIDRFLFNPARPFMLSIGRADKRKNFETIFQSYGQDKELQAMANLAIFTGVRQDTSKMPVDEKDILTNLLLLLDKYDLYGKMSIPKKNDPKLDVPEI